MIPLSRWVTAIAKRRHANVAAVALANKDRTHGLGHVVAGYTYAVVPHVIERKCLQTEEESIYGH